MRCPYCGADDSKVIDSRPTEDGEKIRRRRECLSCKKRFTTYEIVETVPLMVIKKDRSREVFDRQKLLNGMLRACEKRPVSYEQLDAAVSRIEQVLMNSYDIVVETTAAVNMMALVSPAALANPKMAPVKIPGSAAGSTVRKTVWVLLAPKAREDSLQLFGI